MKIFGRIITVISISVFVVVLSLFCSQALGGLFQSPIAMIAAKNYVASKYPGQHLTFLSCEYVSIMNTYNVSFLNESDEIVSVSLGPPAFPVFVNEPF